VELLNSNWRNHLAVQLVMVLKVTRMSSKVGLACGTEDTINMMHVHVARLTIIP